MNELQNQIEAILFSVGKKISAEEIARICKANHGEVMHALQELRRNYDSLGSSLMLVEEGPSWKLTVREQYAGLLQNLVAETELSRSILETLAIIAWKAPILQSEIVRSRSSKAYDHISELETSGFITKEHHGRSWLLKLTQKFYDYFALKTKEDIQEKFKDLHLRAEAEQKEMIGQLEVVNEKPKEKSGTYIVEEPDKPSAEAPNEPNPEA